MNRHFDSFGGGIHGSAIVGQMPEDGSYRPGMKVYEPEIYPSARIEALVTIDAGLEGRTWIGPNAWLLKRVHVGHDAKVMDEAVVATGTVIGGFAQIGIQARIGINATILPFRKVGIGAVVGAGAVVTKDVLPHTVVAGNPARPIGPKNPVPYSERKDGWTDHLDVVDLGRVMSTKEAGDYIRAHG